MDKDISLPRCRWCNLKNPLYIAYHDKEWGIPVHDDCLLFEMLLLETFQAGLSWECILNKREAFRLAFDGFDYNKISCYGEDKIEALCKDTTIIRHRLKIQSSVSNAKVFLKIQKEWGTFDTYIWSFTERKSVWEVGCTSSPLSDHISRDLRKKGMRFVGSTVIYSYLQAIGIICSHDSSCFLYTGSQFADPKIR